MFVYWEPSSTGLRKSSYRVLNFKKQKKCEKKNLNIRLSVESKLSSLMLRLKLPFCKSCCFLRLQNFALPKHFPLPEFFTATATYVQLQSYLATTRAVALNLVVNCAHEQVTAFTKPLVLTSELQTDQVMAKYVQVVFDKGSPLANFKT